MEADVKKDAESAGQAKEKLAEAKSQLKKLDKKLKGLSAEGTELGSAAESAEQAKRGLVTQHAQAQVDVSEAEELLSSSSATQVWPSALLPTSFSTRKSCEFSTHDQLLCFSCLMCHIVLVQACGHRQ